MLTAEQTGQLKALLESERERLGSSALEALEFTMNRDRDRVGHDSIDESAEEELYSTKLRLADREAGLLAKIQDALVRINGGTIDECDECGESIGFKRLMARPVTTLCIECKSAREQTEVDNIVDGVATS